MKWLASALFAAFYVFVFTWALANPRTGPITSCHSYASEDDPCAEMR